MALSLIDTRQVDNMAKAMIAAVEVDMNNNFKVVYMIPELLVTIEVWRYT